MPILAGFSKVLPYRVVVEDYSVLVNYLRTLSRCQEKLVEIPKREKVGSLK